MEMSHKHVINPLTAELNPFCHLLALLGARHIFHISRLRVKEAKLCMYEKTVLLTNNRNIKNSLLYTPSITDKLWYNFLGLISNNAQYIFNTKIIIRTMLGLGHRPSCRGEFKKLNILTTASLYIFSLVMFVVRNPYHFETSSSIPL
jgi:hypothetical protein